MVFVVGKAYLPSAAACEQALLEVIFFIPLPGDPSCDTYEFILPQWTAPFLISLSHMASSFATPLDGHNSSACVVCSDYVWDSKMSSKLICSFDDDLLPTYCILSFPRNSLVQFFGLIKDVMSGGGMTVDVKSIVTNVDQISSLGKCKHMTAADRYNYLVLVTHLSLISHSVLPSLQHVPPMLQPGVAMLHIHLPVLPIPFEI
ncbi:hypothetical protein EV401DRAFT_2070182 [Pisolithus croceorrhizus]|nr:hypothetical protein EV401DRAFT_2070182 [Pisolithus croceorrhizus]